MFLYVAASLNTSIYLSYTRTRARAHTHARAGTESTKCFLLILLSALSFPRHEGMAMLIWPPLAMRVCRWWWRKRRRRACARPYCRLRKGCVYTYAYVYICYPLAMWAYQWWWRKRRRRARERPCCRPSDSLCVYVCICIRRDGNVAVAPLLTWVSRWWWRKRRKKA